MVPATAGRYGARGMAPSRPRRTAFRRALPILVLVGLALAGSVTMGPTPLVGGIATAGPTPLASGAAVAGPASASASPTATVTPSPTTTASAASSSTSPSPSAGSPAPTGPTSPGPTPSGPPPQLATAPVLTDEIAHALQARLDKLRVKYAMPGVSVAILYPDGAVWSGSSGLRNVAAKAPVTPDTAFADRERQQDVHLGADPCPGPRGRPRPRRTRSPTTSPSSTSTRGSRSGSCSITRAGCATTSSTRASTSSSCRDPTGAGPRPRPCVSSASPTSSRDAAGTTRTRTTSCSGSLAEPNRQGDRWVASSETRFFGPLGLDHTYYQPTERPQRAGRARLPLPRRGRKRQADRPVRRHRARPRSPRS